MSKKKVVIWVVDDEKSVCDVIKNIFQFIASERKIEIDLVEASSPDMFEIGKSPHILITDVEMGGVVSGIDFAKKMSEFPKLIIIVMSGRPQEYKEAAYKAGAHLFMEKPLNIRELLSAFTLAMILSG